MIFGVFSCQIMQPHDLSLERSILPLYTLKVLDLTVNPTVNIHRFKHTYIYMGEISQGVQSLNLMSYLSGVLRPFFGDLGLCYGKN